MQRLPLLRRRAVCNHDALHGGALPGARGGKALQQWEAGRGKAVGVLAAVAACRGLIKHSSERDLPGSMGAWQLEAPPPLPLYAQNTAHPPGRAWG